MIDTIDPIEQKIIAFTEKVESGKKSSEVLGIDSAVWYIEASLNYNYCDPTLTSVLTTDSAFITIAVSENGDVNFSNIVAAYTNFKSSLEKVSNTKKKRQTGIQLADVSIVENENPLEETLEIIYILVDHLPRMQLPFDANDYWHPVNGLGRCDIYEGEDIGLDATDRIAREANSRIIFPTVFDDDPFDMYIPMGYITDISMDYYYYPYNTEYLWGANCNPSEVCFSPSEMEEWTDKLGQLARTRQPAGKIIVNYKLDPDIATGIPTKGDYFAHFATISYGVWHVTAENEI